jgi:hypothetical protein
MLPGCGFVFGEARVLIAVFANWTYILWVEIPGCASALFNLCAEFFLAADCFVGSIGPVG